MSERKHRCGGSLLPATVEVRIDRDGFLMIQAVPGLMCDNCHEELLEHRTALTFQAISTPSIWFASAHRIPENSAVEINLSVPSSSSVVVPA